MGMVWCYLKPLSTVIRKTTSCLINTENKPQKQRQRVTALVGMSNSLNTALAIKFLTHLKPLHKDYTTLQFQRLWQLLIHTFVTKQEIYLPSPNPVIAEECGGSRLRWSARSNRSLGRGKTELMPARQRAEQQQDIPTWSVWFPRAARLWMTFWDEFSPPRGTLVEEALEKAAQSWVSVLVQEAIHWLLERNTYFVSKILDIFAPCANPWPLSRNTLHYREWQKLWI